MTSRDQQSGDQPCRDQRSVDQQCMELVARGDLDAFGELVRRHQKTAWRVAFGILGDEAEAEDAAQQAFLKILEAADRYQPTASFRTYLYRVVTRHCLDRLAKMSPLYTDDPPIISDQRRSPARHVERREARDEVHRALEKLPARQRAAVSLFHFEGLSYKEIAASMDVSSKAVERLLARGRKALELELTEFVNS
ncbi:MAG: RNA polymerase sigma factor [Persicimonas sp.]